ncbi:hypothetical protein ACHAXT_007253 [Thalassiosira profunda]
MSRPRRLAALIALAACAGANAGGDEPATEATGRRRRRLGGSFGAARGSLDNRHEKSPKARNDGFYDLALMSEGEKLDLIKQAYALARNGDSVDWEGHILTAAVGGNDDAYDGEVDDTLSGDIVVDANGRVIDDGEGALEASDETPNQKHSSNDDDQDSDWDDTLDWETRADPPQLQMQSQPPLQTSHRRLAQFDGDVFNGYNYNKGRCPNAGSLGVPCAPPNLAVLCNKYDRTNGSFRACLDACKPAFCCIHDAPREENYLAPNCNSDENCAQYNYCYIAWWKLHDTVGPALFLRVEQDDEFYDVDAEDIESDSTGDEFFTGVLLHHFDDIDEVIADGTENNEFNADRIFLDEEYWVYPVAGQVDLGN